MYNVKLTTSSSQHATSPRRHTRAYKTRGGAHAPTLRDTRNRTARSTLPSRAR